MPKQERIKTDYPGVYYIIGTKAGTDKLERIYYISFRKHGKKHEEKAGRQFKDNMTPAKANIIRGQKIDGKLPTNQEKREAEKAKKKAKASIWTVDRLFNEYINGRPDNKARSTDKGRYEKYIEPVFGNKQPKDIVKLDVDRIRKRLLQKLSPQTVKHVLNLLTWIINYGAKNGLCEGLSFKFRKPTVNNIRTEDLSTDQLTKFLEAVESDKDEQIRGFLKMALYTGMRRGELFKLKWRNIDFDRGFITLRDPKGGSDQKIPMNDAVRELLENHPRTKSPFVFPGRGGRQRVTVQEAATRIKERAGLPKDFRPVHGLRHAYASMLASSGKVDMYTLQKLLTHKSPQMTQRYAHLRDETLKRASDLAGDIISSAAKKKSKENVIDINQK